MNPHPKHPGFELLIDPDLMVRFARLVKTMRAAQRKYFKTRTDADLTRAKILEHKVDVALAWIEERAATTGQQSLPFEDPMR